MARRSRRASTAKGRAKGWVRLLFESVVVDDSPIVGDNLVQGSDWVVGTMNERATVERIHMRLAVTPGVEDVESALYWAVYRTDTDAPFVDPHSTALLNEDLLGLGALGFPGRDPQAVEAQLTQYIVLDFKAARRITNDMVIKVVFQGGSAGRGWTLSGFSSSLIVRGSS